MCSNSFLWIIRMILMQILSVKHLAFTSLTFQDCSSRIQGNYLFEICCMRSTTHRFPELLITLLKKEYYSISMPMLLNVSTSKSASIILTLIYQPSATNAYTAVILAFLILVSDRFSFHLTVHSVS